MAEKATQKVCGHQNHHFQGDGALTCDLELGHDGDHSAVFHAVDYKEGKVVFDGERRTYWNDAAGEPMKA